MYTISTRVFVGLSEEPATRNPGIETSAMNPIHPILDRELRTLFIYCAEYNI